MSRISRWLQHERMCPEWTCPWVHGGTVWSAFVYVNFIQGVARGSAQALALEKKCLEKGTGLNNYSQGQRFSPLAGTSLIKFLATPLVLSRTLHSCCNQRHTRRSWSPASYLPQSFVRITSIDIIVLHPSRNKSPAFESLPVARLSLIDECCCIQTSERSSNL